MSIQNFVLKKIAYKPAMSYVPGKISLSCGVIASYISCIDKITKTQIFYAPLSTIDEVKRADTNDYITTALLCNCIKRKTGLQTSAKHWHSRDEIFNNHNQFSKHGHTYLNKQLQIQNIHKINDKTLTSESNSILSIVKTITSTEIETIQIHSYRQFEDNEGN